MNWPTDFNEIETSEICSSLQLIRHISFNILADQLTGTNTGYAKITIVPDSRHEKILKQHHTVQISRKCAKQLSQNHYETDHPQA